MANVGNMTRQLGKSGSNFIEALGNFFNKDGRDLLLKTMKENRAFAKGWGEASKGLEKAVKSADGALAAQKKLGTTEDALKPFEDAAEAAKKALKDGTEKYDALLADGVITSHRTGGGKLQKAGSYITWGIRKPFEMAGIGAARVIDGATYAFAKNPYLTTGAVAAAGTAYGLNEWQNGQRQGALETQAQVQQAMMQSQYMNSVSPHEAALLESRMRSGGVSMAEMEEQRRAAQQGQPASNV